MGQQVGVTAPHAGDDGPVGVGQVQFAQAAADDVGVGDEDAPEIVFAAIQFQLFGRRLAQPGHGLVHLFRRADQHDPVAQDEGCLARGQGDLAAALDARQDDVPTVAPEQFADGHVDGRGIGDNDRARVEVLLDDVILAQRLGLGEIIDAVDALHDVDGQQHGDDAHRIGYGVADDRLGTEHGQLAGRSAAADGLQDAGQRRGIGQAAGIHAGGHRGPQPQQRGQAGGQRGGEEQDEQDEQVIAQSFALE